MDLAQKNVVYIGGSGGIGSATCKRLVQKNLANLVILDLVENTDLIEELNALSPTTNLHFLKIDLRCKEDVTKAINDAASKIERIDVLVNGSGLSNEFDADLTIGVNLLGLIHVTMAALNFMDKSKGKTGGTIVNIASVAGLNPSAHVPVYTASKAGVVMFTRSMAENYSESGVSFITICPGFTRTGLLDQFRSEDMTLHAKQMNVAIDVIKNQAPDDCAKSMIEVLERNKNGAVYICDVAKILEITIPKFWDIQR